MLTIRFIENKNMYTINIYDNDCSHMCERTHHQCESGNMYVNAVVRLGNLAENGVKD